jgi:hypothetical protein
MPNASGIANEVAIRARALDRYLQRMERLFNEGSVLIRDVERAYGGALLEFHAFLERSIERLFVGLLRGRLVHSSARIRSLISVQSDVVAHKIIVGERFYVDWLPFERFTMKRAQAFFASGLPFCNLEKSDHEAFDALSTVRNALAHQSAAALHRFEKRFIDGKLIPPTEHRPTAYLRGSHTIGQSRMNFLLSRAVIAMDKLCG